MGLGPPIVAASASFSRSSAGRPSDLPPDTYLFLLSLERKIGAALPASERNHERRTDTSKIKLTLILLVSALSTAQPYLALRL